MGLLPDAGWPPGTAYLPPAWKLASCISVTQCELPKNTTLPSLATITAAAVAE